MQLNVELFDKLLRNPEFLILFFGVPALFSTFFLLWYRKFYLKILEFFRGNVNLAVFVFVFLLEGFTFLYIAFILKLYGVIG